MSVQHLHMEWAQSLLRLSLSSLISVIQFHPSLNNPALKKKKTEANEQNTFKGAWEGGWKELQRTSQKHCHLLRSNGTKLKPSFTTSLLFCYQANCFQAPDFTLCLCLHSSLHDLRGKGVLYDSIFHKLRRKFHWGKKVPPQVSLIPLFNHNCPVVPSALTAQPNRDAGSSKTSDCSFMSWRRPSNQRSLEQSRKLAILGS